MNVSHKLRQLAWGAAILIATTFGATQAFAQGGEGNGTAFTPQSGFWTNPNEINGRGLVLQLNSKGEIFASLFMYTDWGQATWYVVDTAGSQDGRSGQLQRFVGGQALNGDYRTAMFDGFVGEASFVFDSPISGTLTFPGGTMSIQRYNFVAGGVASGPQAGAPGGGWWFNSAESGRGFFLEAQGDSMLLVVMGYDDAHQPVWYTARGAMTTPQLFQGQLIESYGGQTMGGEYQQPNAAVGRGNITVQFSDDHQGMITLPSGRQTPIVPYTF